MDKWKQKLPHGITREDLYNYYMFGPVQKRLKQDLFPKNKPERVIVIQNFDKGPVLRRNLKDGRPIIIDPNNSDPNDPSSLQYWIGRRTLEFHKVYGKNTNEIVLDLDPGAKISDKQARITALDLAQAMGRLPIVDEVGIHYSGGRGYYIIGKTKKAIPINDAREIAFSIAKPLEVMHPLAVAYPTIYSSGRPPQDKEIKVDLAPMKYLGSRRALQSLNTTTGNISVGPFKDPIELQTFKKSHIKDQVTSIPQAIKFR